LQSVAENGGILHSLPDDEFLFDSSLLKRLNWSEHRTSFRPGVSPSNPGEHLVMRPLSIADFSRGKILLTPACIAFTQG
jgi:hypothetical protein